MEESGKALPEEQGITVDNDGEGVDGSRATCKGEEIIVWEGGGVRREGQTITVEIGRRVMGTSGASKWWNRSG